VIDSSKEDLRERLRAILGMQVLDVFIDNTGSPAMIEAGYELTGPQGRVILVGVPRKGANITIHSLPLHFGKTLKGSHGGNADPQQDIPRYMTMFKEGRLALNPLITDEFSLPDINKAIARMRSGAILGRCLINMSAP
jgi:S-(hydroxymethyl)glutathione dehydrogenase/alcohol dehydrogenase